MAAPLTYAEVSAAMGALLMLFVGLSLRELIALMRQILARQRECPTLYADRERNDKAHKEFLRRHGGSQRARDPAGKGT